MKLQFLALLVASKAENITSKSSWSPVTWPHAGQTCYFRCKDAGFCCGTSAASGNQMISCSQACLMRARGTPEEDLIKVGGICERTASSGCSLHVNGHSYSFCGTCSDATERCPHGVESSEACDFGAKAWTSYLMAGQEVVNAAGCDCSWIYHDNCLNQDHCAKACRQANLWGTCQVDMAIFP